MNRRRAIRGVASASFLTVISASTAAAQSTDGTEDGAASRDDPDELDCCGKYCLKCFPDTDCPCCPC